MLVGIVKLATLSCNVQLLTVCWCHTNTVCVLNRQTNTCTLSIFIY